MAEEKSFFTPTLPEDVSLQFKNEYSVKKLLYILSFKIFLALHRILPAKGWVFFSPPTSCMENLEPSSSCLEF